MSSTTSISDGSTDYKSRGAEGLICVGKTLEESGLVLDLNLRESNFSIAQIEDCSGAARCGRLDVGDVVMEFNGEPLQVYMEGPAVRQRAIRRPEGKFIFLRVYKRSGMPAIDVAVEKRSNLSSAHEKTPAGPQHKSSHPGPSPTPVQSAAEEMSAHELGSEVQNRTAPRLNGLNGEGHCGGERQVGTASSLNGISNSNRDGIEDSTCAGLRADGPSGLVLEGDQSFAPVTAQNQLASSASSVLAGEGITDTEDVQTQSMRTTCSPTAPQPPAGAASTPPQYPNPISPSSLSIGMGAQHTADQGASNDSLGSKEEFIRLLEMQGVMAKELRESKALAAMLQEQNKNLVQCLQEDGKYGDERQSEATIQALVKENERLRAENQRLRSQGSSTNDIKPDDLNPLSLQDVPNARLEDLVGKAQASLMTGLHNELTRTRQLLHQHLAASGKFEEMYELERREIASHKRPPTEELSNTYETAALHILSIPPDFGQEVFIDTYSMVMHWAMEEWASPTLLQKIAGGVRILSREETYKMGLLQCGVVEAMIAMIRRSDMCDGVVLEQAAAVMSNLALKHAASRAKILQCGGVPALVYLLSVSQFPPVQEKASAALAHMACSNEMKTAMAHYDAIPALIRVCNSKAEFPRLLEEAARALRNLCHKSEVNCRHVLIQGGIEVLGGLCLDCKDVEVIRQASAALTNLSIDEACRAEAKKKFRWDKQFGEKAMARAEKEQQKLRSPGNKALSRVSFVGDGRDTWSSISSPGSSAGSSYPSVASGASSPNPSCTTPRNRRAASSGRMKLDMTSRPPTAYLS